MACDTFLTIAQKCRRQLVARHTDEREPFVNEILLLLPRVTVDLSPSQVQTFYEAVGHIITMDRNAATRQALISKLMELPTSAVSCG